MTGLPPPSNDDAPAFRAELPPAYRQAGLPDDLVRQYYAGVYCFGLATLGEAQPARQTALHALAAACHDRNALTSGGRLWLYNIALRELHRLRAARSFRAPGGEEPPAAPAIGYEAAIRRLANRWDEQERQTAVLYYLLQWPVAEIAALLKVNAGAVQAQLTLFRNAFAALPESSAEQERLPETQRIPPPDRPALTPAEARAVAFLQTHWPVPDLNDTEIVALAEQVEALCASGAAPVARRPHMWPLLGAAGVLLVIVIAGAVIFLLKLNRQPPAQGETTVAASVAPPPGITALAQPSPFPTIQPVTLLSHKSTSAEIIQRWQSSRNLWHSITIDVQSVDYGPPSYIGPPRRYRSQGWVLQPENGIQLVGLLSQPAGQVNLVGGGRIFTRSYVSGRSSSRAWPNTANLLLPDDPLHRMVFPGASSWAGREGSFWWAESTEMLGRRVEVYDWLNHLNEPEARLYLDAQTGIILREQTYTGEGFELLRSESVATELQFERREPPPALIVAAQQSQAQDTGQNSGFLPLQATPTAAMPAKPRPPLPLAPAPAGMDPSRSRLYFQFADIPEISERVVNTADTPATLFADGYYLGETRFGLPWALRCARSVEGGRLAFNTASDGASAPDDGIHWFNLSEPGRVYQPMPGFHAEAFAFSPDGRSLAASGSYDDANSQNARKNGLYRVDLALGEAELLIEVDEARSLVWSPDGNFVALIGRLPGEDQAAILVVNVGARLVIFQGEPGAHTNPPPANSLIPDWDVAFPSGMGDMETCAAARP